MDAQIRAENEHVHEDPNKLYYISFYLEKEGAGTPIHGLMHLLRHRRVATGKVDGFFDQVRSAFIDYLDETQSDPYLSPHQGELTFDRCTFSLALPRLLSNLIYHCLRFYPEIRSSIISKLDSRVYLGLVADSINTIVAMHEIRGKLWIRNGHNIRYLVSIYRAAKFCSHTFDMDMHSLQLAFSYSGNRQMILSLDSMIILLGSYKRISSLMSLQKKS